MTDYGRDIAIGKPPIESTPVNVLSNIDVVSSLSGVVDNLMSVIDELKKVQAAFSFILGEEIDLEEE